MRPLVEKLEDRRTVELANDTHHVKDVVAIEPARSGEQDEIIATFFDLVRLERGRHWRINLLRRNEFVVIGGGVQHAGWGAGLDRNRHAAFGRDQSDVAHGSGTEQSWKMAEISTN